MLNFNHLFYFHVAATEGTVARAAERLGVTQPTVSEQIKLLERALEETLFDRTPGGLRLTRAGRIVYEHTSTMFSASERMLEALGKAPPPALASLRIGVSAAVSRTIATDFLLPVISLENCLPTVHSGDFAHLLQGLRRHDLDLVLGETLPIEDARRGLHVADLHRPRLVAIAGRTMQLTEDWAGVPLIQYGMGSSYRWEADSYLGDRGLRPRVAAETDDALLMLEAAARGACIAFVPRSLARDAIAAGRVRVLATLEPSSASVHAFYHDTESAELARRAVALLVEYAASLDRDP